MKKAILALAILLGVGTTNVFADSCPTEQQVMAQIQQKFPGATGHEPDPGTSPYEIMKKVVGEWAGMHNGVCGKWIAYRHSILGIEYGDVWYEFVPLD